MKHLKDILRWWIGCAAFGTLCLGWSCAWAQAPSADPLVKYLRNLQLDDLLAVHLQEQLDKATDDRTRELVGRELISLYTGQIESGQLSDDALAATIQRLERVLLASPQLRTPELEILLLQAAYQQAFLDLNRWMEKRDDEDSRTAAVSRFTELAPRFTASVKALQDQVDELQALIDVEEREAQVDQIFAEQSKYKAALLRATYYAAWNDYYLAVGLANEEARGLAANRGRQLFADFLSFDLELDYELADAESLELELPLRARAGLGMAVMEYLSGESETAQRWLDWLGDPRVDSSIRNDRNGEFILAMLLTDQYDDAIGRARAIIRELGPPAKLPTVRLSRTLARYGEYASRAGVAQAETLRSLGYEGLVRQRQFQLALDLMSEFESSPPTASNFFLGWLDGYQLFRLAEESNEADDFRVAAERLAAIDGLPGAKSHLQLSGYFQMQLGWARYQSGDYEAAVENFAAVVPLLKQIDRDVAVDASWMRALSLQQLATEQPSKTLEAIEAFQKLALEFADHPKATEARYQIGRLQRQAGTSANPVAALERVESDDPNYLLARYEICLVRFDQWKQATEAAKKAEAYAELIKDVDQFCRLGDAQQQAAKRLRCRLVAVDAAMGQQDQPQADRQLNSARSLADQRPPTDPLVAQYHYWRLMQARRDSQPGSIVSEARWLVDRAQESTYRQAGLVYLTQQLESQFAEKSPEQQATMSAELVGLYRQLVQLLGVDTKELVTKRNARVALYKLGWHEFQLKQYDKASKSFDQLLAALPDNETYLRWAGLAAYQGGQYQAAVGRWSRLSRGLDNTQEGWFEARYYELDSLRRFDKTRAQKIWRQFQLLHPDIPFPQWQSRYDVLADQLKSS